MSIYEDADPEALVVPDWKASGPSSDGLDSGKAAVKVVSSNAKAAVAVVVVLLVGYYMFSGDDKPPPPPAPPAPPVSRHNSALFAALRHPRHVPITSPASLPKRSAARICTQ